MLKTKKCEDKCPNCGSDSSNIYWGEKELCGSEMRQQGDCQTCGFTFHEYSAYKETVWETKQTGL